MVSFANWVMQAVGDSAPPWGSGIDPAASILRGWSLSRQRNNAWLLSGCSGQNGAEPTPYGTIPCRLWTPKKADISLVYTHVVLSFRRLLRLPSRGES